MVPSKSCHGSLQCPTHTCTQASDFKDFTVGPGDRSARIFDGSSKSTVVYNGLFSVPNNWIIVDYPNIIIIVDYPLLSDGTNYVDYPL